MLTDEELVDLVAQRYAGVEPDISLNAVERRGRQRRRNLRIATGTAVVAVVMAVAATTAFATTRTPKTPPANPITTACRDQYAGMYAARSDRALLPARLPAPIIDMHHGAAAFRLYANPATATGKRFVFDCGRTASGAISAHLTVGTAIGVPVLGDADADDYYRDYLPDGSGTLVGDATRDTSSITVATADGTPVPVVFSHGFFVAWSSTGDLDDAAVTYHLTSEPNSPAVSREPTIIPGTFDPAAFGPACVASFTRHQNAGFPAYHGQLTPSVSLQHGNDVIWVYVGNSIQVCDFQSTATEHGFTTYGAYEGKESPYGIRAGTDNGWVVGWVPRTVTAVRIVTPSGQVTDATTADGAFIAWTTGKVFGDKHTKVIATSPTETYTIVGNKMTTTPN